LYPCRPVQVQDELFSWNSLTAIDWLIHEEQLEQANRLLHFVISQPIALTARKSAHMLIDQLAEIGVEKTDETEVEQMDFAGLMQELKDALGVE
jgi:hypothetical protein